MIAFQNVTKSYKSHRVLKNISLTIQDHELVVIIGLSGSGKTTMLKLINKLIKPTSGKIIVNESDLEGKNVIDLRRDMGYVVQQVGLFPHMTIEENIEIIERLQKKDPEQIQARTQELLDMVGLEPQQTIGRYPNQLSGGQQQRVGVARAFATNPDIILMDEPFSALDPITRNTLQDELLKLQSKLKKTIVFVTHDMDEAIKLADKICIMDQGEVVQYDTPEQILKHPANDFVQEFVGKNRIWSSPEYIKAQDIMRQNPVIAPPELSVKKSLEMMRSAHVDTVLVAEADRKLLGIVYAEELWKGQGKQEIREVMYQDYVFVHPEDSILEVLELTKQKNVQSIPVVDNEGTLRGLITKSRLVITLSAQYLDEEVSS